MTELTGDRLESLGVKDTRGSKVSKSKSKAAVISSTEEVDFWAAVSNLTVR
jgi:hypothetical protein